MQLQKDGFHGIGAYIASIPAGKESGSAFGTVLSGMEALHRILTISAEG